MHAPLHHWLRLLWGTAPALAFDSDCAYIAAGGIHLPAAPNWQQHTAAAAHAAAHLVYSPRRFDGAGLGPIARVLLALLEDARVEALAMRELPGLARLWRPLHTATPNVGVGFEGLAARLARSLCDPAYEDPDPWVRKGRALCFLDAGLTVPAIRTPAELRTAAMRLGHDIGQLRLPFNARAALPLPAYRDDHRWMWAADALQQAPPPAFRPADDRPPEADDALSDESITDDTITDDTEVFHHPEWDRLIARLRPDWCRVVESNAAGGPAQPLADSTRAMGQRLLRPVRSLARQGVRRGVGDSGDAFDIDALVNWQLGRRMRRSGSALVYRARRRAAQRTALWLVIDQSASSAGPGAAAAGGALAVAVQSALALGLALQAQHLPFGLAAFDSNGRHQVHWRTLKTIEEPFDERVMARAQALRPRGSTRLGAVLRHATQRLAVHAADRRWVLLLSDGSPHDIDMHDPLYLVEDARRAVAAAARHGVRVGCLVVGSEPAADAARIFGGRAALRVADLKSLPPALMRLLA